MKLYLLRHEERDINNPLPMSPLTSAGFINSLNLIKTIDNINPDIIYCSPFLRTIETIYPYCLNKNKKINIENSLYEYLHASEFNLLNYIHKTSHLKNNEYNKILLKCINDEYESLIDVYDINFPENEQNLLNRVHKFINKLTENKKINNKKILIVTHMSVINAIKSYNTPIDLETFCKMGSLEKFII